MNWTSWHQFWVMGGHALYVWGSVGVVFALIAAKVCGLVLRQRSALADVRVARALKALDFAARNRVASRASEGRE